MNFPPSVLRWEALTREEIARGGYPFPVEYPLSVCLVESGGSVGEVNPKSGASGLMQVMPGTLATYNKNNSPDVPLSHLRSTNPIYAPEQMRVGLWVMGRYLKQGYNWIVETTPNPALSDIIKISDLMYVRGPAGVKRDFKNTTPHTFAAMETALPNYQPFAHPRKVWKWTTVNNNPVWDVEGIDRWVTGVEEPPAIPPPNIATTNGFMGALLILALASWYLQHRSRD
jgi:hypothetical protein